MLPAGYVAEHVELGYAVNAHRAQGMTVDTAHVLATPAMTPASFYVAMTRGRHANTTYVARDATHDDEPQVPRETTPRTVLAGVLRRSGTDLSAHQSLRAEQDRWGSAAQLAAQHDTIATVVERDRWIGLLSRSGLDAEQLDAVLVSDAFGPLCAALRRAQGAGYDVGILLPLLVGRYTLVDADDMAAVLHHRLMETMRRRPPSVRAAVRRNGSGTGADIRAAERGPGRRDVEARGF
jgi:hypothetical protein